MAKSILARVSGRAHLADSAGLVARSTSWVVIAMRK